MERLNRISSKCEFVVSLKCSRTTGVYLARSFGGRGLSRCVKGFSISSRRVRVVGARLTEAMCSSCSQLVRLYSDLTKTRKILSVRSEVGSMGGQCNFCPRSG